MTDSARGADESWGVCLIAPTLPKNGIVDLVSGSIYSCDMVRVEVRCQLSQVNSVLTCGDVVRSWTDEELSDEPNYWGESTKTGSYRHLWTFPFGDSSISFGMGHIDGNRRTRAEIGFVEGNPNKVRKPLEDLLRHLLLIGCRLRLVRWDLAIDYPVDRADVRLLKDGRKYECQISRAFTEYLGQRNKPGRVKVYDKQQEAGLDRACTRVELTCDGEWGAEEIIAHLPICPTISSVSNGLTSTGKTVAMLLAAYVRETGAPVEPWLQSLSKNTRSKYRKLMASAETLRYDSGCISRALDNASDYVKGHYDAPAED